MSGEDVFSGRISSEPKAMSLAARGAVAEEAPGDVVEGHGLLRIYRDLRDLDAGLGIAAGRRYGDWYVGQAHVGEERTGTPLTCVTTGAPLLVADPTG